MPKKTLKKAIEENDLESFIKEHENDPEGDLDKVEEVIRRSDKALKQVAASELKKDKRKGRQKR